MSKMDKYRDRYMADLAPHVQGQIRAVGIFSRPGSMTSVMIGQLSGAGHMVHSLMNKKKAGGLPMNVVLAVTDDQVYLWKYKPGGWGGGLKVKDPIVVWPRAAIHAQQTGQGTWAKNIVIEIAGQEPIQLDSNQMPGFPNDFNDPFLAVFAGGNPA
jgi:hypothetical protein